MHGAGGEREWSGAGSLRDDERGRWARRRSPSSEKECARPLLAWFSRGGDDLRLDLRVGSSSRGAVGRRRSTQPLSFETFPLCIEGDEGWSMRRTSKELLDAALRWEPREALLGIFVASGEELGSLVNQELHKNDFMLG